MSGTFHYGVICEQVRREDNGKLILIGVYGDDIQVHSFPAPLVFSLLLKLDIEEVVEIPIEFRIRSGEEMLFSGKAAINPTHQGSASAIFPNMMINAQKEGVLDFEVKLGSGDWQVIDRLPIAVAKL